MQSLGDRLPPDLRSGPAGREFRARPFSPLYLLDDEFAAEVANRTVHAVMHLGGVPDGSGGYRGQLAALVKPNGLLGACYMAAIRPFRNLIVYRGNARHRAGLPGSRRRVRHRRPAASRRSVSCCGSPT